MALEILLSGMCLLLNWILNWMTLVLSSGEQRLAQPAQQVGVRFTKRRIVLPGILPELTMRRRRGRPRR